MKNKSYKKILALTMAATLVGGNAVATFATEGTTNVGVTAETNYTKEVTFNLTPEQEELGIRYSGGEFTASRILGVDEECDMPTLEGIPDGYELTGWSSNIGGTWPADWTSFSYNDVTTWFDGGTVGYASITPVIEKKAETAEAILRVHFVDENNEPLEGKDSIVTLTKTGEVGGDPATFSGTDFAAPEGYTLVENDLSVEVAYGSDKDINVTVKKLEEEKKARTIAVNTYIDLEKGEFTDAPGSASCTTGDIPEDSEEEFYMPSVTAKEGYVFTGWKVEGEGEPVYWDADKKTCSVTEVPAIFPEGSNEGYVTVTAQFEEVKPETAEATLRVHYVDENNVPLEGKDSIVTLTKTGEVGGKATFSGTDFEAPEGYTLVKNDLSVEVAYGSDADINVNVKKLEEEKEARDVIVNFNVASECGEFTDPAGAKVVTFTIKEDDENQYLVPTVKAKEGYVFTGWEVQGEETGHWDADAKTFGVAGLAHFPEGLNEGYVTVTAQFNADATLRVHYVDENNVPLDGEQYIVTKTKSGKAGETATFSGTDFEAPEGYTLVENDLSVDVAYGSDADINVKVKKLVEEKEARDVKVTFNVDPEKGEFTDPAGAEYVNFTIKEDDGEQYLVPTVAAKEGYVFTGWLVNGEDEGHWDADAKTFGVTGLAHFPKGSNEGYVTVTAQFEEVKPEVAVANANVVVDPDKGSFDGYDGATTLNNEHLEEADYTLGYLPTVTAKDGYKWTGWVVTNKAGETILDLDTNASSIAFDYGVADTYTVTAKFETVTPEQPGTPEQPTTPDQSATDTKTDKTDKTDKKDDKKTEKKTDKKTDKKSDKKSDKKKTPKTGDASTPIVYMVTLIGAAVAAVLALIKRRKF